MMQTADAIARFFSNSPKRQLALEEWVDTILQGKRRKKLKEMCRTRWVERHEAFEVFADLFLPTVSCLEAIANSTNEEWNRDTRSDAMSLLLAMSQFSFTVALVATQNVLAYTKGLSVKLQGHYVDVARAHRDVDTVKATLQGVRSNVSTFHSRVYRQATQMAQCVGIEESSPRLAGRQQHRSNIQAENCSDYYQLNLTIPLLDHLISELNARFDATSAQNVTEFMHLLPSAIMGSATPSGNDFQNILQFYNDDLPFPLSFDSELDLWQHKWTLEPQLASELDTPEKALPHTDGDFFPNIRVLFRIMATLPVTSCECERSISMLKFIKSPLRSSMGQDRLNGLAMLFYHRNVQLTAEEVVAEFATRHPRRMLLTDPFD